MDGPAARVWVVSELYWPEDTSTGYYLTRIAEGLAREFPVRVLCAQPTYAARGQKAPKSETRNGVTVRRCWGTAWNKDVLPLRLVNLLTISLSIFFQALLRFRRGDRVLVVTNPPLLPFLIAWACRIRRAECVLLVHDVYPDVLVATGFCRPDSLPVRLLDWCVSRLYRSMRSIVVLGRDMAVLVRGKLPTGPDRVAIIPNWADCDEIRPVDCSLREQKIGPLLAARAIHQNSHPFVVQYAGNMGRTHNLEAVVECARRLIDEPDIRFLLVGSGARKEWVRQTVADEELANVIVADRLPREELPALLAAADVSVISFVPGMAGVSVPSRLYNVLAAGCPVIAVADTDSELALVVREENVGWVVPPGDDVGFANAVREAHADPERLRRMSQRARQVAETRFGYEGIIQSYCNLMRGDLLTVETPFVPTSSDGADITSSEHSDERGRDAA